MNEYKKIFQKYFKSDISNVEKLNHNGNNCIYIIDIGYHKFFAKNYSKIHIDNWQRGKCEFESLSNLWQIGFRNIPEPIAYDLENNMGIYSYEKGRQLKSSEIKEHDIMNASEFLIKLYNLEARDKLKFNPASTHSLSPKGYILDLEKRVLHLKKDIAENENIKEGRKLFYGKIVPITENLIKKFSSAFSSSELENELPIEKQSLCFGDFGFHNILIDKDYIFLDFEYFGRDDATRELLGFLHHDKHLDLSKNLKNKFLKNFKEGISSDEIFEKRLRLADPLKGMSWVLTYMNVLSTSYIEQLKFLGADIKKTILDRLEKAEKKLNNLKYFE